MALFHTTVVDNQIKALPTVGTADSVSINQWDEQWENGTFDTTTGANINTGVARNQIRAKNKIPVVAGTTVRCIFPLTAAGQGLWAIFYDANDNVIPYAQLPQSNPHDGNSILIDNAHKTLQIPSGCVAIRFYVTNAYPSTYNNDISINYPSTDTQYHANKHGIATFDTDKAERLINLEVAITATGGGGTPVSPIAINGYSQANISVCGKNFLNVNGQDTTKGFVDGQFITYAGSLSGANTFSGFVTEYFPLKSNTQYVISGITGGSPSICFYDKEKNFISGKNYNNRSTFTFTTSETVAYARASIAYTRVSTAQIEKGSSPSSYSAFNGTTETIPFGQTVYGGRLNVGSGVLTVTWGGVDLSTLAWSNLDGRSRRYSNSITNINISDWSPTGAGDILAEKYQVYANNTLYLDTSLVDAIAQNNDVLYVRTSDNSTPTGYFIYWLETPTTIQLDSKQIQSIIGTNNIYADTGDIIDLKFILTVGKAIS